VAAPRILLDTNLYINLLLSPHPFGTAVASVLDAARASIVELLLPADVIAELTHVVKEREHLRRRLSSAHLEALLAEVTAIAVMVPELDFDPPAIVRDQKDDYLIALAVLHAADYIVTRDKDLLSLGQIVNTQIIGPATLLSLVRGQRS
jgi:putative PIN family toxin of toxin-antitoxin system